MPTITIPYVTNRAHVGKKQFEPTGYGIQFSKSGPGNLRYGKASMDYSQDRITSLLEKDLGAIGSGDGEGIAGRIKKKNRRQDIKAYPELLQKDTPQDHQGDLEQKLGSHGFYSDVKEWMDAGHDILIYVHGYNVDWDSAISAAAALQLQVNHNLKPHGKEVRVVLFTWPSNGSAMPWVAYGSDRDDAKVSGTAFGRAFLKLRDYLYKLRTQVLNKEAKACGSKVHLLCHSMGNYVLENALSHIQLHMPTGVPTIFEEVFLCAADVDDTSLELEQGGLRAVHDIGKRITVYSNKGDTALCISDWTKGHRQRLGSEGPARMSSVHQRVRHVSCSAIVEGIVEHSYYLSGTPNNDIALSILGLADASDLRLRAQVGERDYRLR